MSKYEKREGVLKPKHAPEPVDSKLIALRRKYRKRKARYVVQQWQPRRWSFIDPGWSDIGSSRQLHEALALAKKQDWRNWVPIDRKARRVYDIQEGEVVETFGPPTEHAE